jgi:hypothetical protein
MFFVTPISALLYILNSSGMLPIFSSSLLYQEVEFGTSTFYRDFQTIPVWLVPIAVISFQSLLTKEIPIPKYVIYICSLILPVAVLFTFTRSLLMTVLMQIFIIVFMYYSFSKKLSVSKLIRNTVFFVMVLLLAFVFIQKVFENQYLYFAERLSNAAEQGTDEQNVAVRLAYLDEASLIVKEENLLTGAGFNRSFYERMNRVGAWIADSTIPYHLLHTGCLGVLLIYSILLYFIRKGIQFYILSKDWLVLYLCSFFIGIFISSLIMGGGMLIGSVWTLMNFALFTTIRHNLWKKPQPTGH